MLTLSSIFLHRHIQVQAKTGVFSIDDGPKYNNLADLIKFYMEDPAGDIAQPCTFQNVLENSDGGHRHPVYRQ